MIAAFPLPFPANLKDGLRLTVIEKSLSDEVRRRILIPILAAVPPVQVPMGATRWSQCWVSLMRMLSLVLRGQNSEEAAKAIKAQSTRLKHFFAIAFQPFNPPFLGWHKIELIQTPVIILGSESKLGQLYKTGLKMEQKALELHQDHVEEARLDCLAMEIVEWKKKTMAR